MTTSKVAVTLLPCIVLLLFFVGPLVHAAQHAKREFYVIEAHRVQKGPHIDGFLDDEVWQSAALIDQFTQQEPKESAPATERTEVRILYDARCLFIGVYAFDSNSAGVIATEMRRDSDRLFDEDNFQVIIDTFNDSRSGYMFVTNPLGAKLEQQIFEEAEGSRSGNNSNVNRNWDGVWAVASRRTKDGWTAEIAIPMMTLRFRQSDLQTWGINFMRSIRRKNEQVFWAPIPKPYTLTRVSLAGTLTGLSSLTHGMDLRIKPFIIAGVRSDRAGAETKTSILKDLGLDMKYGISSGMNLDLTFNTDFAQVEVDEQQVNLTRFSLLFPEKRDFFLENAGQFKVGTQRQEADLFFSRRMGLSESGQVIPIIGGARLTGKVGRNNIALMNIQTAEAFGQLGENFLVTRYSRDLLSRSKVGGIFINKESTNGSRFNRTMAADATLALRSNLLINSFVAKTSTPGITKGDMAFYGRIGWRDAAWNLYAEYLDIQDNFNAEVGFVPRRGIRTSRFHIGPTPRPKKYHIRMVEPMVNVTYTTDQNNRLVTRKVHYMVGFRMENGTYINFIYNRFLEELDKPFRIRPNLTIPPGSYRFGQWVFELNSDPSRRVYQQFRYSPQTFFGGLRKDLDATVGIRASSQFAAEVQYKRNDVKLPGGAFEVNVGILRLDWAFSPRMTLRSLVQYNSSTHEISTNIRFNFIYRPGSDLYVVYKELRNDAGSAPFVRDRQLMLKLNYLLAR
ncbi:carbohydrate binding family 9 domain-containing protein [Acidobacteria bacterium AH-259-O06]|nr:carbohydrate binding family 9 domain-containing protein [Acidobacteria bacterium AH-259-L09]MDA2929150.1 carbohydrate binding family 9 domain-containing protein [Acidobacteria bacterium AH-259-O06]